MSRLARLIVPGFPHHVTQRGNRRAPVFFEDGDYVLYRLMPNHVHLILVPRPSKTSRPQRTSRVWAGDWRSRTHAMALDWSAEFAPICLALTAVPARSMVLRGRRLAKQTL
jgi:putative transposase